MNSADEMGDEDRTVEDLKNDYLNRSEKLNEALVNYMGENDLENSKTRFPDKWEFLTKNLAYPYEFFNCIEDYQKFVDN